MPTLLPYVLSIGSSMDITVERAILVKGRMVMCAARAAAEISVGKATINSWISRGGVTSYGYRIRTVRAHGRSMLDEHDVRVVAATNKAIPLGTGMLSGTRREAMLRYALRLQRRLAMTP